MVLVWLFPLFNLGQVTSVDPYRDNCYFISYDIMIIYDSSSVVLTIFWLVMLSKFSRVICKCTVLVVLKHIFTTNFHISFFLSIQ